MAIGKRLKELLKQHGMTVRELAEKSGVSENTLYAIIKRDNKTLNPDIAAKISEALQVSIDQIILWDEYVESARLEMQKIMNPPHPTSTDKEIINEYADMGIDPLEIATYFSARDFTEEELEEIKKYADFLISRRKEKQ